jgi:histidine triad (HIT) family protein
MCIFCKIVDGEIPNNGINESEEFLAFHDINPKAPIHVLIIPKKHICCFQESDGEMMANITPFIQETASKLGIDKTGYRLITNNGEDGGQEVHHLHFHILGGAKLKWDHQRDDIKKNI